MNPPTVVEVTNLTRCIPNLNMVMHSVIGVHDYNGDTELTWGQFLLISFIDSWLLNSPGSHDAENAITIAGIIKDQVVEHVEDCDFESDLDFFRVGVADRRYLVWSDNEGFVDIKTNDRLEQLPYPPVATFSVDINAVLFRYRQQLEVARRDKDAVSVAVQEIAEARSDFEERGQLRDEPNNDTTG